MKDYLDKIYNEDVLSGIERIADDALDLVIADPPYRLGKDYGNNSDKLTCKKYLEWTEKWVNAVIPKIKETGSLYIFLSWRHSPEIFSFIKTKMIMVNEIIWDRRVPSMGGSTRRFSSVHDNIGFFAKTRRYYFDLDSVRIPYDPKTKKARTRSIFVGKKWLELGYNPKDIWSLSRIHAQDPERQKHPTQKPIRIVERMIKASCPRGGIVLDPFMGSGTTAVACIRQERHFVGFEVNREYCRTIEKRIEKAKSMFPLVQDMRAEEPEQGNTAQLPLFGSANLQKA